jgi:hypothetical protein
VVLDLRLPDVSGFEFFQSNGFRRQSAELLDFIHFVGGHQANFHVPGDAAFQIDRHQADID